MRLKLFLCNGMFYLKSCWSSDFSSFSCLLSPNSFYSYSLKKRLNSFQDVLNHSRQLELQNANLHQECADHKLKVSHFQICSVISFGLHVKKYSNTGFAKTPWFYGSPFAPCGSDFCLYGICYHYSVLRNSSR